MSVFGAHMSIAGGLDKAVERAVAAGCACLQIFTKNNNQWNCKPLESPQLDAWRQAWDASGLVAPIAHASYLINLAAPDEALYQKSIDALAIELQRAEQLRLEGLVFHPGAYTTGDETSGMERIAAAVRRVLETVQPQHCRLLLENTAGQGSCLGHRFAQLGWLIEQVGPAQPIGVCLDTCHAFAAGYALNTPEGLSAMKRELDAELPSGMLRALHLNDSKKPCGSRVDRHEHIGEGYIGAEGFRRVLGDPLLRGLPGYLETPKGQHPETGEDLDVRNLATLRRLADRA